MNVTEVLARMPDPEIRKGMPSVNLTAKNSPALPLPVCRSGVQDAAARDSMRSSPLRGMPIAIPARRRLRARPGQAFSIPTTRSQWIGSPRAMQFWKRNTVTTTLAETPRILVINGSSRSEHTCPGEMSKSWRLVKIAEPVFAEMGYAVDLLDLSRTTSEFGKQIHPCKSCVSTSIALCHWPCSCYPNYSLGQTDDWMNEIYPLWVAAHGIMIVTPVNWYHAPGPLKAMMDRLVCADGGNPDPSSTHGKNGRRGQGDGTERVAVSTASCRAPFRHCRSWRHASARRRFDARCRTG